MMQPKLLRVLEEKVFERVGGNTVIESDFRLIAATNQNLERLIDAGPFPQGSVLPAQCHFIEHPAIECANG
jgi:transcriptional regulator with PAS, ATPase and Fis domain